MRRVAATLRAAVPGRTALDAAALHGHAHVERIDALGTQECKQAVALFGRDDELDPGGNLARQLEEVLLVEPAMATLAASARDAEPPGMPRRLAASSNHA